MTSLLSGTILLAAVGLFSQLVGFGYRLALSRLVGAETMGLYQLIMPVYSTLMSLSAIGLTTAASTLSARYHALGDRGGIRAVRSRSLSLFFAAALPLGVGLIALSDPISVYLLGDARTRLGVILLVPCVLLTGVENIQKHCFYGIGLVRPPAFTEVAEQLIRSATVLLLLVCLLPCSREEAVGIIVLGMVLCEIFSASALTAAFSRWRRSAPSAPARELPTRRHILSIAVPVACTSLLGTLLNSANAVLIPAKLVEGGMGASEAVAAFGVLFGMTLPLLGLPTGLIGALCLVLVPNLAHRHALGDRPAVHALLRRVMSAASLTMAPAMAVLSVVGPELARCVFRESAAGEHILLLAAGTLLTAWQSVLSSSLNGLGRQRLAARNAILSDVVQLAFTVLAVPRWGLGGFALGFLLSALVGMALNLLSVLRCTGLSLPAMAWFVSPLLAALLMGVWMTLLRRVLADSGMAALPACLVTVGLGVVLYLAALAAQGVFPRRR